MANQDAGQQEVTFNSRWNSRKCLETSVDGKHVSIPELRDRLQEAVEQGNLSLRPNILDYLIKEIPPFPTPVEFEVSKVTHATNESGLDGILHLEGFGRGVPPEEEFTWWHLKIDGEEIKQAEKQYVMKNALNQAPNQAEFLEKFTTSPAFKQESRYGNYRFTFPLTELMEWYKEQECKGNEPVLRVYKTTLFPQEIMYAVLIHSPEYNQRFKNYPLLEQSEFVGYNEGSITWKAQAICETHQYQLVGGEVQWLTRPPFYVWDQVSLAFYLPNTEFHNVLRVPRKRLIEALEACELDEKDISCSRGSKSKYKSYEDAKTKVRGLREEVLMHAQLKKEPEDQ